MGADLDVAEHDVVAREPADASRSCRFSIPGSRLLFALGPMASFIPEVFETRFRYTGAGLAFKLGGMLRGALPETRAKAL